MQPQFCTKNKNKIIMAAEIPTLVWEELDPFPHLENISEGEDEPSDVSIFVSDHDVLDCSICCEPLKPPIFQVISSPSLSTKYLIFFLHVQRP